MRLPCIHDEPALNLTGRVVGTVVEVLSGDTFEVEFCGPNGEFFRLHPLRATRLKLVPSQTMTQTYPSQT